MDKNQREKQFFTNAFDHLRSYLRASPGPGLNKVSEVTTHIFISNVENAHNTEYLREYGFKAIICTENIDFPANVVSYLKKKKAAALLLPLAANPSLSNALERGFAFIHDFVLEDRKVLVCCRDGAIFSPVLVLYYLLRRFYTVNSYRGPNATKKLINPAVYHLLKLVKFIRDARPCVDPDIQILKIVLQIEGQMKKQIYARIHMEAQRILKESPPKKSQRGEDDDSDDDLYEESVDLPEREVDLVYSHMQKQAQEQTQEKEQKPKPTKSVKKPSPPKSKATPPTPAAKPKAKVTAKGKKQNKDLDKDLDKDRDKDQDTNDNPGFDKLDDIYRIVLSDSEAENEAEKEAEEEPTEANGGADSASDSDSDTHSEIDLGTDLPETEGELKFEEQIIDDLD